MSSSPPPPPYQPGSHPSPPAGFGPGLPPSGPKRVNGLGIASLVVGIVAFVGAFVPVIDYATGFVAFVGIVLGVVGLFLAGRSKRAAIAGVIVSAVALVASIILAVVYTIASFGGLSQITDEQLRDHAELPLVYEVDGTGSDATITYTNVTNGITGTEQLMHQALPISTDLAAEVGAQHTYDSYTLTVTNGASDGDVTCRIILDGTVLEEQTASGAYATASCTASPAQLLN